MEDFRIFQCVDEPRGLRNESHMKRADGVSEKFSSGGVKQKDGNHILLHLRVQDKDVLELIAVVDDIEGVGGHLKVVCGFNDASNVLLIVQDDLFVDLSRLAFDEHIGSSRKYDVIKNAGNHEYQRHDTHGCRQYALAD